METTKDTINSFKVDQLLVNVYSSRLKMGKAVAAAVGEKIKELLTKQNEVSMVFAAAASQGEFLDALCTESGIDWSKVIVFHMDEYIGLPENHSQRFGNWLKNRIFDRVKPGKVFLIDGNANYPEEELLRYTQLLKEYPVDITCMGIGENGHIAFNDPAFADFNDPLLIKIVEPDEISRRQQVNDGCFITFEEVPTRAFTLTIPALINAKSIYCTVPGLAKSEAVRRTLFDEISTACPASIIRNHPNTVLFLDPDSAQKIVK